MPKQTPGIGPQQVGPEQSNNGEKKTDVAGDYAVAAQVMGRSEEPKLQGKQNVTSGGSRGGEAPIGGGLPQATPPSFGEMSPGSYSPAAPGRPSLPSTNGPVPTNPAPGAYAVLPLNKTLQDHPSIQADFSSRFYG
jgi:hypothetical protein